MKWYQKTWFMWLMLVFISPVGIFLLWKYRSYNTKVKTVLSVIFAIWFIVAGMSTATDKKDVQKPAVTQTQQEEIPDDVKSIKDETKLTTEQSRKVVEILKQCGFDEFGIKYDSTLDNIAQKGEKGYIITYKDMTANPEILMSITPDGNVYQIIYAGNYIYNDGAVQAKIQDYYLSLDDQSKVIAQTQLLIDKCLKAPKTAEYQLPSEWKLKKTPDSIRVSAYVDADNSFGAKIRSDFTVTYSSDLKTVKSVIIDGQEYMK